MMGGYLLAGIAPARYLLAVRGRVCLIDGIEVMTLSAEAPYQVLVWKFPLAELYDPVRKDILWNLCLVRQQIGIRARY